MNEGHDAPPPPGPTPAAAAIPAGASPTPPPVAAAEFAWTPELAAGRVPGPTATIAAPRRRRWLDWLVWIVGVLFAIGLSSSIVRATYGLDSRMDARDTGRVFGTMAAAFLLAFALWGIATWISRRRGTPRRLASPIVPLLAMVLLFIRLSSVSATAPGETALAPSPAVSAAAATAAPSLSETPGPATTPGSSPAVSARPSVDPAIHAALLKTFVIDPPYTLQASPPDEESEFLSFFSGEDFGVLRDVGVRRVVDDQGIAGFVVVADMDIDPAFEALSLAGIEIGVRGEGGTTTRETLNGRTVLVGESGGAAFAMWVEAPYMKIVYGSDIATVRAIGKAFVVPK